MAPTRKKAPPQAKRSDGDDELALFRSAKFVKESPYGELRFLKRGEQPEDMGPMHLADWFAQEADGAMIGRLRLDGVHEGLRPVVVIDNEGSLHVTGFSLVDHFGSYPLAASQGELEELLAFCRKHGLPGPRTSKQIDAIAKRLKLTADKLEAGKVPAVTEAALLDVRGPAPALPAPAKAPPMAPGKPSSPQGQFLGWAIGPDGAPWVIVPPKEETKTSKSTLHRWTGARFVSAGEVRGWIATLASFQGQLAYEANGAIAFHDGTKETARIPLEGDCRALLASKQHLAVYSAYGQRVLKLDGGALVRVGGEVDPDAKTAMLDDHRLLLLWEKKAIVIDLNTGKQTKWPKPAMDHVQSMVVANGELVVSGYEQVATVSLESGKWSPGKKVARSLDGLVALDDGDVVGFAEVPLAFPPTTEVFRINTRKLAVTKSGALASGRKPVNAFPHGKSIVVFGGTSGTTTKLVPPELFDLSSGTGRAV